MFFEGKLRNFEAFVTFQGSFQAEAVPWCPCLEELSMCCLCCIRAEPHPVQQWKHRDLPPVPGAAVCLPARSGASRPGEPACGAPTARALQASLQMPAAPLDEDTQVTSGLENSPGQLLWINAQGVLEGGGELLKTGSYLNQLLTCPTMYTVSYICLG